MEPLTRGPEPSTEVPARSARPTTAPPPEDDLRAALPSGTRLVLRRALADGSIDTRSIGAEGLSIRGHTGSLTDAPEDPAGEGPPSSKRALVLDGPELARVFVRLRPDAGGWWLDEAAPSGVVFVDHEALVGRRRMRGGERIYIGVHALEVVECSVAPRVDVAERPTLLPAPDRRSPTREPAGRPRLALLVAGLGVATVALALDLDLDPEVPLGGSTLTSARGRIQSVLKDMSSETYPQGQTLVAPATSAARAPEIVEHEVVPGETFGAIAARYRASAWRIAEDNRLRPDRPLTPGQRLTIEAVDPPLPRLRLRAQVQAGDTWADLHARYGLGKAEIQGQNPGLGDDLEAGVTLDVWVEPQVRRRQPIGDEVDFPVLGLGRSIGSPSAGHLDGGIELPESPLYIRRNPRIMFGSAHAIAALQRAIHRFRRAYAYEGVLVVADLSRPGGGPLPPHLSHQSGRDVDIWLPTLRGAYDQRYLAEDRRPAPDEVNWPATWGLIDSLLATGSVQYIFLSKSIQDRLYRAAEVMGASSGELAKIQWQPEGVDDRSPAVVAPIRDAFGHTGHIHVRFTCGPGEGECLAHASKVDEP
ncbi:MAG: penicillin-insensitive murein endopeptidase [Nannocystaceae bacterium]